MEGKRKFKFYQWLDNKKAKEYGKQHILRFTYTLGNKLLNSKKEMNYITQESDDQHNRNSYFINK